MKQEIWKDIEGYNGKYRISSYGRVFSVKKGVMMKFYNQHGYLRLKLTNNGREKDYAVHRLVAEAFIPNPDNLPFINHKDEDKANNKVENLEWCTAWYNSNYSFAKPVAQYTLQGELVAIYLNARLASKCTGIDDASITCVVAKIKGHTAGGYVWKFAENTNIVSVNNPEYYTGLPYRAKYQDTRKKIKQYDLQGNFIAEYESASAAARAINGYQGSISSACKGYQKSACGYLWRYEDEPMPFEQPRIIVETKDGSKKYYTKKPGR